MNVFYFNEEEKDKFMERAKKLGLEKVFDEYDMSPVPTHCLLCRKAVNCFFAPQHTELCLRNYNTLIGNNKRKAVVGTPNFEDSPTKRTRFSNDTLPDDDDWSPTIAADIERENGSAEYPFNEDNFAQIPYQRERVRKQQAEQKKKEEKEAKKTQGNSCYIHKIMSNRCSQDKTTQTPKSVSVIIGEQQFFICKFSHLNGNDLCKIITSAWKKIPVTETTPAPNNQRCCNPRCKDKSPGVMFFRAGGRDMEESKWWYYCQLRCLVTHLFETSTKTWDAYVSGKQSGEDKANDLDTMLNSLE